MIFNAGYIYQLSDNDSCRVTLELKAQKICFVFDVNLTVHRQYVEIKCQLDATEVFIAHLIACSTCFGHHYAHRQERYTVVAPCGILCCGFQVAGLVWS